MATHYHDRLLTKKACDGKPLGGNHQPVPPSEQPTCRACKKLVEKRGE